jgi:4-amino-4-deoxy-L-arabinose transferase-like glycosyltransferase
MILAFVGLAILLPDLGALSLTDAREARHAEIAREMADSGNYLVPHYCGRPYIDKPPLFNWFLAALFKLTGRVDMTIARLPGAISGLVAILGVYALGRRWFNARTAFWAALLFAISRLTIDWSRMCRMDIMMACLVLWAILLADLSAGSRGKRATLWWLAACIAVGSAVLAKGPQALLFFAVPVVLVWKVRRGRWIPPLAYIAAGVLMTVFMFAAWAIPAEMRQPGHLTRLFGYEFGEGLVEHPGRVTIYFDQVLLLTAPWSIFGFGAFYLAVRHLRKDGLSSSAIPPITLAICIVVLTLTPNRREHYLLPAMPMWSLMLAWFLDSCLARLDAGSPADPIAGGADKGILRWAFLIPLQFALALAVLVAVGGAAAWPSIARGGVLIETAFMIIIGGLAMDALIDTRRNRVGRAVALLFVATVIAAIIFNPLSVRYYREMPREIAQEVEIARSVPSDGRVAGYDVRHEFIFFTLNRPVFFAAQPEDLKGFLQGDDVRYVITLDEHVDEVKGQTRRPLRVLKTWQMVTTKPRVVTILTTKQ